VAALHGAVALAEMDDVAVLVAEDLHLDVLRARNVFLEKDGRVAECALGLALRLVEQRRKVAGFLDDAHAAAAAAEGRLDDEREADRFRDLHRLLAIGDGLLGAGQVGTPIFCARARAAVLSPIKSSNSARGPTKMMPAFSQARAKFAFSDRKP